MGMVKFDLSPTTQPKVNFIFFKVASCNDEPERKMKNRRNEETSGVYSPTNKQRALMDIIPIRLQYPFHVRLEIFSLHHVKVVVL